MRPFIQAASDTRCSKQQTEVSMGGMIVLEGFGLEGLGLEGFGLEGLGLEGVACYCHKMAT